MKLVIAEKPMLGRDIARAMCGKSVSESARLPISGNGYTVIGCVGHLLKLVEPDYINKNWKWDDKFELSTLPISQANWPKVPSKGKESLVKEIKELLDKCDSVVHAGDPDDEGQLIVDELLDYYGYKGKVERVLVNDNIEKNIRKAFDNLEDNSKYAGMGRAAYGRQMADFVFGINESRLAGMCLRRRVSVGRVQTPTLGLIVNRDEARLNHTVQKFYELFGICDIDGNSNVWFKFSPSESLLAGEKNIFDADVLEKVREAVKGTSHATTTEMKESRENPSLPYNLTILQSEMNRRFGLTAQQTLDVTQNLRDKYKAISYNRSDCQYLKNEHYGQAKEVLGVAMKNLGEDWPLDYSIKSKAFNDSNVSAHYGIIPQASSFDAKSLSANEAKVYTAIVERYAMQFLPPQISDVSTTKFSTSEGEFVYKVSRVKDKGYKAVFGRQTDEDKEEDEAKGNKPWLDAGARNATVTDGEIIGKETKPQPAYTEGTLITDMASIAKYVKDAEIKEILKRKDDGKKGEHGGIGTTATRAAIIDKLKEKEFIEVKGKKIVSTEKGREFYHLLPDTIKVADTTAKWWLIQEDIASGKADTNAIWESVVEVFNEHKDTAYVGKSLGGAGKKVVGKCPKCGMDVLENKKTWNCSSNKVKKKDDGTWEQTEGCGFKIFRTAFGKKLSEGVVKQLLAKGTTKSKVKGFKSKKTGKTFDAYIDVNKENGDLKLRF